MKETNVDFGWNQNKVFVNVRLALGELVLQGIKVSTKIDVHRQIWDDQNDDLIAMCYRDGTEWKVKAEIIQDYIDDVQHRQLRQNAVLDQKNIASITSRS